MGRKEQDAEILELEWEMFTAVNNEGGRASCQDNRPTFEINRRAQLVTFSDSLADHYLTMLKDAKAAGRNLMTEKYGYMMADTAPEEYEKIKDLLPAVSEEKAVLLEEVLAIHVSWERNLRKRYPALRGMGRGEESIGSFASFTTYLRGELTTWNELCLREYLKELRTAQAKGENLAERTLSETVRAFGYADLETAEKAYERG